MENRNKWELDAPLRQFCLPDYERLPDLGLYLEQAVQYINDALAPLGCFEITGSMIRNYVKMGLVKNPVKKRYMREHLAHLFAITVLKPVLSLEEIQQMFTLQEQTYDVQTAYNYFAHELQNTVLFRFGVTDVLQQLGVTESTAKEMLRSAVTAVAHIIYLHACFGAIKNGL